MKTVDEINTYAITNYYAVYYTYCFFGLFNFLIKHINGK